MTDLNNNLPEEDFDPVFTLINEQGEEESFELLDLVEYKDEEYVVLLPLKDEEPEEVIILHLDSEDEEIDAFEAVEDEETLQAVFELFVSHMEAEEE